MRFNLLGPLEVLGEGGGCTPRTPKLRVVLAVLLMHANETVSMEWLVEELWGEEVPPSATATLQTYIYHLRKLLGGAAGGEDGAPLLTKPPGYQLRVEPGQVDAHEFERLARAGREALAGDDVPRAADLLRQALGLWRGAALADVERGPRLEAYVARLEEERLRVLEERIEADMLLGRHRELIGELKALTTAYPLHEWFHSQLIVALYRAGRRSEALEVYQLLRRLLREELGLDPSPELQQLQLAILTGNLPPCGAVPGAGGARQVRAAAGGQPETISRG